MSQLMTAAPTPDAYLSALVAGDPQRARVTIEGLITGGLSARRVELEVLAPAMTAIGQLWQEARISVALEHLATAITRSQLAWLAPHLAVPPSMGRTAILAGTPGELHVLGLQMLDDFLTGDGWDVLNLGQALPTGDLVDLVAVRRPAVVGLSTALTTKLMEARTTIAHVKGLPDPPLVIVAGVRRAADAGQASAILRARVDARA
jgi:methanogenic corrinoid protein MtbC1